MTVKSNRFNVLVLVNYSISSFRSFTNNFNSQSMLTSKAMHEYKTLTEVFSQNVLAIILLSFLQFCKSILGFNVK